MPSRQSIDSWCLVEGARLRKAFSVGDSISFQDQRGVSITLRSERICTAVSLENLKKNYKAALARGRAEANELIRLASLKLVHVFLTQSSSHMWGDYIEIHFAMKKL